MPARLDHHFSMLLSSVECLDSTHSSRRSANDRALTTDDVRFVTWCTYNKQASWDATYRGLFVPTAWPRAVPASSLPNHQGSRLYNWRPDKVQRGEGHAAHHRQVEKGPDGATHQEMPPSAAIAAKSYHAVGRWRNIFVVFVLFTNYA